ncbi:MAG: aldehyde dehydrogenase family protein [Thermaerobacter sp.]|nr:aldehyde dehydrogenase family protein [Thermaerobacter sp.]
MEVFGNYIGGEWIPAVSGETFLSVNPGRHSDKVGEFVRSEKEDVSHALSAATDAAKAWRLSTPSERARILYRAADWLFEREEAIGRELTREEGKILAEARNEVRRTAEHFRFYAALSYLSRGETYPSDDAGVLLYSKRYPLGTVAVITPWNFPFSIPGRKIAPALAAGNTVVFKPASETPLMGVRLVEALEAGGAPAGVINLVTGPAGAVGEPLIASRALAGVTFTGSTEVGFHIQRSVAPTCRTQLELGGKNALVVWQDADLDLAVKLAVVGGYNLSGQACTGTSRLIVHQTVAEEFGKRLLARVSALRIGDGMESGVDMGPLANHRQVEQVARYVDLGVSEGARLVYGGQALKDGAYGDGYFITPAIFADVTPTHTIFREEIFGPVLAISEVQEFEQAVGLVNDSSYGLVASICTNDLAVARQFAETVETGMVKINRTTTGVAMNAPFGGWKDSSTATFREEGLQALDFFTKEKTVFMGSWT